MSKPIQLLRTAYVFAVHFCAAALFANFFSNELSHVFHSSTLAGRMHQEYVISALIALALGYFAFYKWRSAPAKWVWIAGALLFAWEAVSLWPAHHYSVLGAQPSFMANVQATFDPADDPHRLVYTLTLLRTIFYSAGAWICWSASKYGWSLSRRLARNVSRPSG